MAEPRPVPPPAPAPAPAPQPAPQPQHSLVEQMIAVGDNPELKRYMVDADLAKRASASGYYTDLMNDSAAMIKIQIGRDLDIPPSVALQSITVSNNKVTLQAELLAAMMKRAGYSWRFIENNQDATEIACYYQGKPIMDLNPDGTERPATVRWTRQDSERAGLLEERGASKQKSVHEKYGSDMGWWRALTRFQRKYAPEVSKGMDVYTPDEAYEMAYQPPMDWAAKEAALLAAAAEKEKANDPA